MRSFRRDGLSYSEIAKKFGISRQRIHQILSPPRELIKSIKSRSGSKCENCGISQPRGGHIHHISEKIENRNNMSNLEYLCPSCHRIKHLSAEQYFPPRPNTSGMFLDDDGVWQKKYDGWPRRIMNGK